MPPQPRRALLDDNDDEDVQDLPIHNHNDAAMMAAGPIPLDFDFSDSPPESPFQQLVRHWLNERQAPDLLPVQAEVLNALLDHIRRQVCKKNKIVFLALFLILCQTDTVQALRGDPDSSEAEHARIMLVQTEVERVKFVVRSYIRTRLYKVTHILSPLLSISD
jgi:hypothetical protein